jgi:N-acetylmuramoyl-L-alanine amidase
LPKPVPAKSQSQFEQLVHERDAIAHLELKSYGRTELEAKAKRTQLRKIVLDPDDGSFPSDSADVRRMSGVTLQITQKIKSRLAQKGYEVELTREDAQPVSLSQKLERIIASDGDLLLSIRVGISPSADTAGVRVLYPSQTTDYSVGKSDAANGNTVPLDQQYTPFVERSKSLASLCLSALKNEFSGDDSALLPAPLYFGRRAPMPSILIVTGYISNPSDRNRLLDEMRQDRIAELLARAIDQFASGMRTSEQLSPAGVKKHE